MKKKKERKKEENTLENEIKVINLCFIIHDTVIKKISRLMVNECFRMAIMHISAAFQLYTPLNVFMYSFLVFVLIY